MKEWTKKETVKKSNKLISHLPFLHYPMADKILILLKNLFPCTEL